jgi:hypothetical protein
MRYIIPTFILFFNSYLTFGQGDSVVFSTNGVYALVKESACCSYDYRVLYNRDKNDHLYFIIKTDSVFEITYDESNPSEKYLYINGHKIYKVNNCLTYPNFIKKYSLTLNSILDSEALKLKVDTIKSIKQSFAWPCNGDSSQYFQVRLSFFRSGILLTTDTFITNHKDENIYKQISNYNLYYSIDNAFYFLVGEFNYSENDCPDGLLSTTTINTRYIGKNNH